MSRVKVFAPLPRTTCGAGETLITAFAVAMISV
jgi:hypothetical protein